MVFALAERRFHPGSRCSLGPSGKAARGQRSGPVPLELGTGARIQSPKVLRSREHLGRGTLSGWSGKEKGHLRRTGMLGSGETEAAGLRVSSLFPQMAIIHYLDFSCYFLHPPLFFFFFLSASFYFKQLGWRQRMRVRGGGAPGRRPAVGAGAPAPRDGRPRGG